MKYYSETLKQLFDSEKALIEAETKVKVEEAKKLEAEKAKKAERATRAKEVDEALKVANEAHTKAISLLKAFIKDYGYFHTSYSNDNIKNKNEFSDLLSNNFFDILTKFLS